MRLNDIVKTLTAYQALQAGLAGRSVGSAAKQSATGDGQPQGTDATSSLDALGLQWLDPNQQQQDSVQLSGETGAAVDPAATTDPTAQDNSLGSIVESLIRQRQTYSFTLPGIGGMTSPISVTWQVEQAYHVIQFVPAGQSVDTQA